MPNKTNLRRWASALRSGQYEQGKKYMRQDNKYCCLGVAMDLAIANGVVCDNPEWGSTSTVPAAVNEWFGLGDKYDGLNSSINGNSPANMNDRGVSFAVIADKIEAHYRLLED